MPTHPYTFIPSRITLPNSSPDRTSLARPYTVLPGRITLPDPCPDRTSMYLTGLPYPILLPIRLLLNRPYTALPSRITLHDLFPIGLLPNRPYPATLPDFLTRSGNTSLHPTTYPALPNHFTRPGTPKTSSSASHLDSGLFWPIMQQYSSSNPKPTRITLKQPR
jgi:hypothetical protein